MRARVFEFCIHLEKMKLLRCLPSFSISHSNVIHGEFVSKIFQELLCLGLWNLIQMLGRTCCIVAHVGKRISLLLLLILYICPFFFLSNKNFCQISRLQWEPESTPWKLPNVLWERKPRCWTLFLPSFFHFCRTRFSMGDLGAWVT